MLALRSRSIASNLNKERKRVRVKRRTPTEERSLEIQDCQYPHKVIQCANPKCGTPIRLVEQKNVGFLIEEMNERRAEFRAWLHGKMGNIDSRLDKISKALGLEK
jgi:hypothetical protein